MGTAAQNYAFANILSKPAHVLAMTEKTSHAPLFQPVSIGAIDCANRIVLAPLTRSRAGQPGDVPTDLMALYYSQRATSGLLISEATQISQEGKGYAWTPGIYTQEQRDGWKGVTSAVHDKGGRIVCQLWHVGRISHPVFQPDNGKPVAPSAITPDGQAFVGDYHEDGPTVPFEEPRALEADEIPRLLEDYRHAARMAKEAGFDGVEVHAANGYLLDQFLRSSTNTRTDAYGGSEENRIRLMDEVVAAVCEVFPASQVGVRLSPMGGMNDISDDEPMSLFTKAAQTLAGRGLAYLHVVRETSGDGPLSEEGLNRSEQIIASIREAFDGALLVCGGLKPAVAADWVSSGRCDAAVFGRLHLANPDLAARIAQDGPYNDPDPDTFYGGDAKGYTDYPTLDAVEPVAA